MIYFRENNKPQQRCHKLPDLGGSLHLRPVMVLCIISSCTSWLSVINNTEWDITACRNLLVHSLHALHFTDLEGKVQGYQLIGQRYQLSCPRGHCKLKSKWGPPVCLSWLGVSLQIGRSGFWFQVRAYDWVVGSVPSQGSCKRQPIDVALLHQCFSLPLSSSLPL